MNRLHEQINGMIRLDGTLQRLPILDAWKNSPSVFWVNPSFPATAMNFKVFDKDKSGKNYTLAMEYHPARGMWRVYVPGDMMPSKCETYYKITALDENGARHVCGEGVLRVHAGHFDYEDELVVKKNCFVYFADEKWRRVTVFTDKAGSLAFQCEQNGLERRMFDAPPPSQAYAFNTQTSLYHTVNGFVDSSGEAYISIGATGVSGKNETLSMDDTTGFYYRLEAFTDDSGEISPKVGDRR